MDRPFNPVEKVLWLLGQAVSHNFVMVARLSSVSRPLTNLEPVLRQALDIVQERHPPLRCRVKKGQDLEFVSDGVPRISLRVIERKDDNHWLEETEKEMLEPLPFTKGPLVRLVQLTSKEKCDLLVTFSHMIADATAGVHFVHNLLRIAGKLLQGETPTPQPSLPVLPFSVELLREDVIQKARSAAIPDDAGKASHEPVELNGDKEVPPHQRITRIIYKVLFPPETQKLAAACKREKTSVHGALCAALLQTVVGEIRRTQDAVDKGPLMIGCCSPVDIRHLFKRPLGEDVGDFITDALHYQLVDDNASLWETARDVKKSLIEYLNSGNGIKALLNVGDFLKAYSTPIEILTNLNKAYPPVVATNLGRIDIPEKFGNINLVELHFTLTISPPAKNGFAIAVTTFHGRMTINFLYSEPYLSKGRANRMVEDVMKRLREAVQ